MKAYRPGQVGLLHKIKCKEVLWVACIHCNGEVMVYWATDSLYTCARTGSRFKVTQLTIGGLAVGRAEFQKSGLITLPKQKKVVLTAGADLRSSLEPYPARYSEDSMLSWLWSHQVMLQGQERPWNFILPTSCFLARAAAQASQSHQRVMCGDEPLRARPFSMNNLIVCSLHTSESGKPWCWLLMLHPILISLPPRPPTMRLLMSWKLGMVSHWYHVNTSDS